MLRGVGRFNHTITKRLARYAKEEFCRAIAQAELYRSFGTTKVAGFELVSFSGYAQFEEQLLSILSFIKHVGTPYKWTVISDGTHRESQIKTLGLFPFVRFMHWSQAVKPGYGTLTTEPLAWQVKKLLSYASIEVVNTTIFLDSDILFFNRFCDVVETFKRGNWYLSDLYPHLEPTYSAGSFQNFANAGFLVLNSTPNWQKGVDYILSRLSGGEALGYFSDQTAIEIVARNDFFHLLDPRVFLLELDDHFRLKTTFDHKQLAIRHFVGPVRFRMWLVAKQYAYFLPADS